MKLSLSAIKRKGFLTDEMLKDINIIYCAYPGLCFYLLNLIILENRYIT